MKNRIILALAVVILVSCSAPKYSYYFSHQKQGQVAVQTPVSSPVETISVDPQLLTVSTSEAPVVISKTAAAPIIKKTYFQMNRLERKTLRHQLKKDIKSYLAAKKNFNSVKGAQASGMDHDLKLAVIFGAVGVVGLIIGGDVFYIVGAIMLLIGVVFFVKWIIRQ